MHFFLFWRNEQQRCVKLWIKLNTSSFRAKWAIFSTQTTNFQRSQYTIFCWICQFWCFEKALQITQTHHKKSYNLLKLKKKSIIIKFQNKLTKFKIILVKSFYRIEFKFDDNEKKSILNNSNQINQNNIDVIKQNDFNEINQNKKVSNQQNTSNDTLRIELSNSQFIKRDRKKLKKFSLKSISSLIQIFVFLWITQTN